MTTVPPTTFGGTAVSSVSAVLSEDMYEYDQMTAAFVCFSIKHWA